MVYNGGIMTKGIYSLTIPGCNKIYIGRSANIEKRYGQHLRMLQKGKHHNPGMKKAFRGELNYSILLEGNDSAVCEQRELDKIDRKLQFNYYPGVDDGYLKRLARLKARGKSSKR
jgi:predicted GIY-YIG superfamily endonuclease